MSRPRPKYHEDCVGPCEICGAGIDETTPEWAKLHPPQESPKPVRVAQQLQEGEDG